MRIAHAQSNKGNVNKDGNEVQRHRIRAAENLDALRFRKSRTWEKKRCVTFLGTYVKNTWDDTFGKWKRWIFWILYEMRPIYYLAASRPTWNEYICIWVVKILHRLRNNYKDLCFLESKQIIQIIWTVIREYLMRWEVFEIYKSRAPETLKKIN